MLKNSLFLLLVVVFEKINPRQLRFECLGFGLAVFLQPLVMVSNIETHKTKNTHDKNTRPKMGGPSKLPFR